METAKVTEKSKGQEFKEKNGITKTFKRNMQRYDLVDPDDYRSLRKKRKKTERIARKAKKDNIRASKKVKIAVVPNKKK